MPSSTSASSVRRATYLLGLGCLAIVVGVEATARVGLDRVSRIQRRVADEYRLARTIGNDPPSSHQHVLVVGNSLLLEDVQFDRVRDALGQDWDTRRFVVEQTYYYDWYYGLKRLFREGARPDVVVVMLTSMQWIRPDIRGDYSIYYLMSSADLPDVARDLRLDATQTANLALANVSKFWGARAELRNFLLGKFMPDLGRLMNFSSYVDTNPVIDNDVAAITRVRLARMKALVNANGARLVVVLPVVMERQDGAVGVLQAAQDDGVTALLPVKSGAFGSDFYRDAGFHLNPVGAAAFTERLIPALRQGLASAPKVARRME